MKTVELYYQGNFRYLLLLVDGQYYLIDRRPRHIVGYLLIPLNWYFYYKIYPITLEDYLRIKTKHSKVSKFLIPSSIVGGLSVLVSTWVRVHNVDVFQNFNTNLTPIAKGILLLLAFVSSFLLLQIVYILRKNSMQLLIGKNLDCPLFYKVRPEKPLKLLFKIVGLQLLGVSLIALFVTAFLYLGNIAVLLGTILMTFIYFAMANGAIYPNERCRYQIVDVLPNLNEK